MSRRLPRAARSHICAPQPCSRSPISVSARTGRWWSAFAGDGHGEGDRRALAHGRRFDGFDGLDGLDGLNGCKANLINSRHLARPAAAVVQGSVSNAGSTLGTSRRALGTFALAAHPLPLPVCHWKGSDLLPLSLI